MCKDLSILVCEETAVVCVRLVGCRLLTVCNPFPSIRQCLSSYIVWRIRGKVIRTGLCCIVYHSCIQSYAHYKSSSYACWFRLCFCFVFLLNRASLFLIGLVLCFMYYFVVVVVWLSNQCNQLPGKTRLRYDLLCSSNHLCIQILWWC